MYEIGNLLGNAMKRHGIDRQVTATVIVARANEILNVLVTGTPLFGDVTVVVYKDSELVIACPHAPASHDVQGFIPPLLAELEVAFPDKAFRKVVTRIVPASWYTGQRDL